MATEGVPLTYLYRELTNKVAHKNYLIGIGNTLTPWIVEGSPPNIDMLLEEQTEISLFLPAIYVTPVINYPQVDDDKDVVLVGRDYYAPLTKTYNSIKLAGAVKFLVRARLPHSIAANTTVSYRSLGVYDNLVLTEAGTQKVLTESPLSPQDVISKRLIYLKYIPPISIQSNIIQIINIVVQL